MSIQICFDGVWHVQTRQVVESALRSCIGAPPDGEEWNVTITSYSNFRVVLVKTANAAETVPAARATTGRRRTSMVKGILAPLSIRHNYRVPEGS